MENRETIGNLFETFIAGNLKAPTENLRTASALEELRGTFEEDIKSKVDTVCDLAFDINKGEAKQAFAEGFSLAVKLIIESLSTTDMQQEND